MPRRLTTLARFSKGLVTDRITEGALIEANDVIPVVLNGGWRTRAGKRVVASLPSTANGAAELYPSPAGTGANLLLALCFTGSAYLPVAFDAIAGTNVALPYQARNAAGTANTYPYGVNDLTGLTTSNPRGAAAVFANELWIPAPASTVQAGLITVGQRWGGVAAATSEYVTGAVAVAAGSNIITGTGTTWTAANNVRPGMYIVVALAGLLERAFRIVSVNSATQLVVDRVINVTGTTLAYRVTNNAAWSVKPGTFGAAGYNASIVANSTMQANAAGTHQGRVVALGTVDLDNVRRAHRFRWSATEQETEATLNPTSGSTIWGGAEYFHPNAYIDVAPGEGGIDGLVGSASHGGYLFLFKRNAVYVVRGSLETDGRDTGASVELITNEDGLATRSVPIVTGAGVYWAGANGVYLMTGSSLVNITDRDGLRAFYTGVNISGVRQVWSLKGWTGERLILQNQDPSNGGSTVNTLVYYPKLGLWCTQSTWNTLRVYSATNTLNAQDEVSIIASDYAINAQAYGSVVSWASDQDFTTAYAIANPNLYLGRSELPTMRLTSHPITLKGGMNGRIREARVRAKLLRVNNGPSPTLSVKVVLGEEGISSLTGSPELPYASQSFPALNDSVTPQVNTERWLRMPLRQGTPPVASVRLSIVQTNQSFDCRVYEAEVGHVAVDRQRT